jgi:hypothetical protein
MTVKISINNILTDGIKEVTDILMLPINIINDINNNLKKRFSDFKHSLEYF